MKQICPLKESLAQYVLLTEERSLGSLFECCSLVFSYKLFRHLAKR